MKRVVERLLCFSLKRGMSPSQGRQAVRESEDSSTIRQLSSGGNNYIIIFSLVMLFYSS